MASDLASAAVEPAEDSGDDSVEMDAEAEADGDGDEGEDEDELDSGEPGEQSGSDDGSGRASTRSQ